MFDLDAILDSTIDGRTKGWPQDRPPVRLRDLGGLRLSLLEHGLEWPAAVLRQPVLDANAAWMSAFLRRAGVSLCPHGKTTMAPQLFHRQIADGAWGLTVATPQQLRVAWESGLRRLLLANQLLSGSALRWVQSVLDDDPDLDITLLLDSEAGLAAIAALAGTRPIPVLLELGTPGGRTGLRTPAEALALARAAAASPRVRLRGVACYEGILLGPDPSASEAAVLAWLEAMAELALRCAAEDLFETDEVLLSAGGSAYFDLVARVLTAVPLDRPFRVLLRSGCYLSHDAAHYRTLVARLEDRLPEAWRCDGHLEAALEVWGEVLSRPEAGQAFLNFGKRDVSYDLGLPQPLRWYRPGSHAAPEPIPGPWRIERLHDQHAQLDLPPSADLRPGDLVACAISHPCTTFDKWPVVYVADASWHVVEAVRTFF